MDYSEINLEVVIFIIIYVPYFMCWLPVSNICNSEWLDVYWKIELFFSHLYRHCYHYSDPYIDKMIIVILVVLLIPFIMWVIIWLITQYLPYKRYFTLNRCEFAETLSRLPISSCDSICITNRKKISFVIDTVNIVHRCNNFI